VIVTALCYLGLFLVGGIIGLIVFNKLLAKDHIR
jgi:hypothetical protein